MSVWVPHTPAAQAEGRKGRGLAEPLEGTLENVHLKNKGAKRARACPGTRLTLFAAPCPGLGCLFAPHRRLEPAVTKMGLSLLINPIGVFQL